MVNYGRVTPVAPGCFSSCLIVFRQTADGCSTIDGVRSPQQSPCSSLTPGRRQHPPGVQPDITLFHGNAHSPSYASLTNNFERVDQLKDYCIPVNSYFPTPAFMNALYENMPYALKYYPSGNAQIAETVCQFADIADPDSVIIGNGGKQSL